MTAKLSLSTVNVGATDVHELATFYHRLLGWPIVADEGGWVLLRADEGGTGLSVQHEPHHVRPVWPAGPGDPQMQLHLEIRVDGDLGEAVAHAVSCGATLAEHQPQDDVRVCIDPAGHPFCLWVVT